MFAESLKHLLKRGDRNSTSSSSNITQKLRQISFRKSKWNTLASRIIEKLPNLMLTRNLKSEECTIQDLKYLWVWVEIYGTRQFPRIIRLKHELSPQDWLFYFVYDPMSPLWVRHDSPGFRYSVRWLGNLKRAVHNLYQVSNWYSFFYLHIWWSNIQSLLYCNGRLTTSPSKYSITLTDRSSHKLNRDLPLHCALELFI